MPRVDRIDIAIDWENDKFGCDDVLGSWWFDMIDVETCNDRCLCWSVDLPCFHRISLSTRSPNGRTGRRVNSRSIQTPWTISKQMTDRKNLFFIPSRWISLSRSSMFSRENLHSVIAHLVWKIFRRSSISREHHWTIRFIASPLCPPNNVLFHSDQYESFRELLPVLDSSSSSSSPSLDSHAGDIDYLRKGLVKESLVLIVTHSCLSLRQRGRNVLWKVWTPCPLNFICHSLDR